MQNLLARARQAVRLPVDNLLARGVALGIAGQAGSMLLGFLSSVALARFLGPADRGLLGLMTTAFGVALAVTGLGVPLAVVYFASRKDGDHGALLGNSVIQALVLAVVLVPLALALHKPIANLVGHGHGGRTWALAAAMVPITFLDWTTHGQLQGMLMFGRFNALLVLSKFVSVVAVLALVGALEFGVGGGLLATAAGSLVMISGSLGPILRRARPRIDLTVWARTVRYGLRVQVGALFQLVNYRLDVLIVQGFRSLNQVGYYVIAETIAELVLTLALVFQSNVLPLVSHYEGDERARSSTVLSVRHYGILGLAAILGNAVFGPLLILVAYGPRFSRAVAPMLIMLPGIWFLGLGIVIQGNLAARNRPGLSSFLAGGSAVLTVGLDFALIPPLGIDGAALASVGAYTSFGIASLFALHQASSIPVRELIVPTRSDLASYRSLPGRLRARLRKTNAPETPEDVT
jgi:O-antigen/teichoic acid export membrane protein